jgi:hypothetical protein
MGLKLFAVFLCCLDFFVLFWCPAISFMIPNASLLFQSSEHNLSCITWLSQSQSKMIDASNTPSCPCLYHCQFVTVYFLTLQFLWEKRVM